MTGRRRRKGAYTLLEMLVVISIILTVLGMFVPCYWKAVQMARHRSDVIQGKHGE